MATPDHLRPWDVIELVELIEHIPDSGSLRDIWGMLNTGKYLDVVPARCNTPVGKWNNPTARAMLRLEDDWAHLQLYSFQVAGLIPSSV